MRKLRFHEQKLLKKVDFFHWELDNNVHELKVLKRYGVQKREDYTKYNMLSRDIRELAQSIQELDKNDPFRANATNQLLKKLYNMGLISSQQSLEQASKISASTFCRRRLPVYMVRSKMAERIRTAIQYIQQGHVRVGTEVILDPAYLVTRSMEDYVTWTKTSAIRKHVMKFNNVCDDYDLLAA